jgi:hypothetical protein
VNAYTKMLLIRLRVNVANSLKMQNYSTAGTMPHTRKRKKSLKPGPILWKKKLRKCAQTTNNRSSQTLKRWLKRRNGEKNISYAKTPKKLSIITTKTYIAQTLAHAMMVLTTTIVVSIIQVINYLIQNVYEKLFLILPPPPQSDTLKNSAIN